MPENNYGRLFCLTVTLHLFFGNLPAQAEPPIEKLVEKRHALDTAYCLKIASGKARPDESRCPGFINMKNSLANAAKQCMHAGGKLVPNESGALYGVDINADGQQEYLFEFNENFSCDGAAGLFACGISSNCPYGLFQKHQDRWHEIGQIHGNQVSVSHKENSEHTDLVVACEDTTKCDQKIYRWNGKSYEEFKLTFRGVEILRLKSPLQGNLVKLKAKIKVLAEPKVGARITNEYDPGAFFVIGGEPGGTGFFYVIPCSACEAGFVSKAIIQTKTEN